MTTTSRSPRSSPPRLRYDRLVAGVILSWHAGCIVLGQMACFVTWEMPLVEENEPPEVLHESHQDGELVQMYEDTVFWVHAEDGDSFEPVTFFWQAGSEPLFGEPQRQGDGDSDTPPSWMSTVVVPHDPELHGGLLSCTISDTDGGRVDLVWPLEVL